MVLPAFQIHVTGHIRPKHAVLGSFDGQHIAVVVASDTGRLYLRSPHATSSIAGVAHGSGHDSLSDIATQKSFLAVKEVCIINTCVLNVYICKERERERLCREVLA